MEPVFLKLVFMSLSAGWLVLAALLIRAVFRSAPRRVLCLLWALVAVRLLCPFSVESRLSLVPRAETVVQSVQESIPAPQPEDAPEQSGPAPLFVLSRVWLAGVAAMLLWALRSNVRVRRRVRASLPQGAGIRVCDEIDTPFVLGVICPRIYLPSWLDAAQTAYVLAHERAHIARHDHWWKPLGWLLLSVYWFQPLLWFAYVLFCRDLELACDERVAAGLDRAGLAAYSEALLRCSRVRRGDLVFPIAFGEVGVKTRVAAVLRYRRPARRIVALSLAAVLAAGVLFLTDRPALAAQLQQLLPEPDREEAWTIRLDDRNDRADAQPSDAPAPEGTADAANPTTPNANPSAAQGGASAPASQSINSVSQSGVDSAALEASLQQHLNEMNEQAAEANRQAAARNIANGSAPSLNNSGSNTLGITPDYVSSDPPPGPTSALTVSTGSGPAHPSVPNPNPQVGVIQYNDGTVAIGLNP